MAAVGQVGAAFKGIENVLVLVLVRITAGVVIVVSVTIVPPPKAACETEVFVTEPPIGDNQRLALLLVVQFTVLVNLNLAIR